MADGLKPSDSVLGFANARVSAMIKHGATPEQLRQIAERLLDIAKQWENAGA